MKRRNFNKSILQQGGLMIEALAMLGLIAVVTPTMYKKSAERTMEVEDINTAATIRTITAAANDYVSANYSTILGDMVKNGEHERKLDPRDLGAYLPYGFDIGKSLYNYDGEHIQLSVSRPEGSNNLTTLMLFPAKLNEENGIGQERTSRIAALIGSSGGYVTDSNKARGIGGIWELSGDHYTKNFSSANKYSIVTVSADTISASAGNEMDYSKYLQRGQDPDDTGGQWKNTMRTDLYMGGPQLSSEDVYHEATGPHSIRNIKSLIVGANTSGGKDGDGNDLADAGGYGLYVAPGAANPNAYIHGSVKAGNGQLNADENNLKYGTGTDDAGNSWVGFNVDTEGTITNLKNLNLANLWGRWNNIQIGALDDDDDDRWFVIKADANPNSSDEGNLYLLGDVAEFHNRDTNDNNNDLVVLADWNWDNFRTDGNGNAIPEINYNNSPIFPIRMGSNTKVDSLLAAGQIDAQKLRLATLEAGSENIDDENKWLKVDKNGVKIQALSGDLDEGGGGTYASYDSTNIFLRTGDESEGFYSDLSSDHDVQLNLRMEKNSNPSGLQHNIAELYADYTDIRGKDMARISGKGTIIQATSKLPSTWGDESDDITDLRDTVDPNTLLLRNDGMQMQMSRETFQDDTSQSNNDITNAETVFSPRNSTSANTRTSFRDMHVDLKDSNFKIVSNNKNIFSIRGNNDEEKFFSYINNDLFTRNILNLSDVKKNIANNYDIALHGNVVIAPPTYNNVPASSATSYHANVSIGTLNKQAGINILDGKYTLDGNGLKEETSFYSEADQYRRNIIMIDQDANNTSNNNTDNIVDPGTIYIRKGYVEVHGEDAVPSSSSNDAYQGNGVLVASRLVANNPTSGADGATVPQLVTTTELQSYENKGASVQRYDTYMVNPAYTSVMHDIKLTTRGGARLSDILPDFINKGIYVVNNTFLEVANDTLNYKQWPTTYNKDKIEIKEEIVDDAGHKIEKNITYAALDKSIDFGKTWASPFMGVVPAPQCPPGYGRVITLTPASFETGISGSLQVDDQGRYYVLPEKVQDDQYALTVRGQRPKYETVAIESVSGSMNVSIDNSALNLSNAQANVSELSGISTAKYVLASNELKIKKSDSDKETLVDPITPLTVQQSTWLKSGVQKLTSNGEDTGYVQGWATTMGFLYKNALYMPLLASNAKSNKFSWNIFPVMPYTLEGYATVYCYFDRTNLYGGRGSNKYNTQGGDVDPNYESYIDKLNYMSNPSGSTMPDNANKAADEKYRNRLNDPNMKYDEVW